MVLFNPCFGQTEIENKKSESHQLVPGTELLMIPPPNFQRFGMPGFMFPAAGANILVTIIPDSNFQKIESELDVIIGDQKLLGPIEDLEINGIQAKFFTTEEIREGDPYTYHTLFYGNEKFLYMLMGVCPSDHPGIIESIKASMLTLVFEPEGLRSL